MKLRICLFFINLFFVSLVGQASEYALLDRTEWHVDAAYGDDGNATGSLTNPFKSIGALLAVNYLFPEFVGADDTIFLAAGNYNAKPIVIAIAGLKIKGTTNKNGLPASVLGDVKIIANGVTLSDCLFLDSELILQDVEGVSVSNSFFSGKTKNSLTLLGASNNNISGNHFESATESCVVFRCDPNSKQSSSGNVFQANYFTHHPEKATDQVILANRNSLLKNLFGRKKQLSVGNRFVHCVFEEMTSGHLKQVIAGYNPWQKVDEFGHSLTFEDCYFKRADRRVPFINFVIIDEEPKWYWDDLVNDTWVTSNKNHSLTGHKNNEYTPSIQFIDSDGNGLVLETEYPVGIKRFSEASLSEKSNSSPMVVNAVADVAVYENAESDVINLFDVFEDVETADEDLEFIVSCDNPSLVGSKLENGQLALNYAKDSVGMAQVIVAAIDNDSVEPKSVEDSFLVVIVEEIEIPLSERSDWYIDSERGNDESGIGSRSNPFKTIEKLLTLYTEQPELKIPGSTVYLGKGSYHSDMLEINIPGLTIEGILDKNGRPVTVLGETVITASGVKLKNCRFQDAGLTLLNVEDVLISNNVFSGKIDISLSLLGSSKNTIQYNEFESAVHDCVHIYWDPDSEQSSDDNVFLRNYFTHRSNGVTNRAIRVNWSAGNNKSISARSRFVECAFKETKKGQLLRVVDDDSTWWMVANRGYSVSFEDCYFKRADRVNPFSEFVILKKHPDFKWRWDELVNDTWVSLNKDWAITGDHNGWGHQPRIQFVDKNENDEFLEIVYDAGILSINGDGGVKSPESKDKPLEE